MAKFPRVYQGQGFGWRDPSGRLVLDAAAAQLLNDVSAEVKRLGKVSAAPPLRWDEDPAGRRVSIDLPPVIHAKLGGAGAPYSYVEQIFTTGTGWADKTGGHSGANAYEYNAVTGLAGKVVELEYFPVSNDWRFQFIRQGGAPCDGTGFVCATVFSSCSPSTPVAGATVTVTDAADAPIGTCTTDSSGHCCVEVPVSGSYKVHATGDCGDSPTTTVFNSCNETDVNLTVSNNPYLGITFTNECASAPGLVGAVNGSATLSGFGISVTRTVAFGEATWSCLPNFGDYTLTYTDGSCWEDLSTTVNVGECVASATVPVVSKLYTISGTIAGCSGAGEAGFAVTISGAAGSGSATTNGSGFFSLSNFKAHCTYSWTIAKTGYATQSGTGTVGDPCGDAGLSTFMNPDSAAGYFCSPCCADPIKGPLTLTDGQGTHALTPTGPSTWQTDCLTKGSVTVHCTTFPVGGCDGGTFSSTVAYWYTLQCSGGLWQLSRTVSACTLVVGGVAGGIVGGAADCGGAGPGITIRMLANPGSCAVPGNTNPVTAASETPGAVSGNPCGPLTVAFGFSQIFGDTATVQSS